VHEQKFKAGKTERMTDKNLKVETLLTVESPDLENMFSLPCTNVTNFTINVKLMLIT
jgi:hypothetical protein